MDASVAVRPCETPGDTRKAIALLTHCPLFHDFSVFELQLVAPIISLKFVTAPKGALVTHIGDSAERLGVVITGRLTESRSDEGRGLHCLEHYVSGGLFGLDAMFSRPKKSHIELTADTASELLTFDVRPLLFSDRFKDRIKDSALQLLANSSVRKTFKIDVLSSTGLRERIMTFFRAMHDKYESDTVQIKMSQRELAEYLGVNRSALSTQLNNMQREEIIEILPKRSYRIMVWNIPPSETQKKRKKNLKNE